MSKYSELSWTECRTVIDLKCKEMCRSVNTFNPDAELARRRNLISEISVLTERLHVAMKEELSR